MENTLQEKIRQAIKNDNLDAQMSVLKMEAVRQKISEEDLNKMIEAEKVATVAQTKEKEIQGKAVEAAKRNKYVLWAICAVAIILEWILIFNAHPEEGQSSHLILTLVVNFITLLVIVIAAAVFFRKKSN